MSRCAISSSARAVSTNARLGLLVVLGEVADAVGLSLNHFNVCHFLRLAQTGCHALQSLNYRANLFEEPHLSRIPSRTSLSRGAERLSCVAVGRYGQVVT